MLLYHSMWSQWDWPSQCHLLQQEDRVYLCQEKSAANTQRKTKANRDMRWSEIKYWVLGFSPQGPNSYRSSRHSVSYYSPVFPNNIKQHILLLCLRVWVVTCLQKNINVNYNHESKWDSVCRMKEWKREYGEDLTAWTPERMKARKVDKKSGTIQEIRGKSASYSGREYGKEKEVSHITELESSKR